MSIRTCRTTTLGIVFALACLWTFASPPSKAHASPTLGFHERWLGTSVQGWGGGDSYSNPGTGGVNGDGDGFLRFSTAGPEPVGTTFLGTQNSAPEYVGNWTAAGITQVKFWLKDVGATDPLEMHFALGDASTGNFWQYNVGFIPSPTQWTQFTVDLTSPASFTKILGFGTSNFALALQNVTRVLIRHDHSPFGQSPDGIVADVGLDELLLTQGFAGVDGPAPGSPRALALAAPFPNPARGAVSFGLQTFAPEQVTLQVVDVGGGVVFEDRLHVSGHAQWTWGGRLRSGLQAAPGSYRLRAFGPSGGMSRPFVLLDAGR
ncbi:MAG: hypothetical protein U0704_15915 [Candidatus Eisenbacteria bacterium]